MEFTEFKKRANWPGLVAILTYSVKKHDFEQGKLGVKK